LIKLKKKICSRSRRIEFDEATISHVVGEIGYRHFNKHQSRASAL